MRHLCTHRGSVPVPISTAAPVTGDAPVQDIASSSTDRVGFRCVSARGRGLKETQEDPPGRGRSGLPMKDTTEVAEQVAEGSIPHCDGGGGRHGRGWIASANGEIGRWQRQAALRGGGVVLSVPPVLQGSARSPKGVGVACVVGGKVRCSHMRTAWP